MQFSVYILIYLYILHFKHPSHCICWIGFSVCIGLYNADFITMILRNANGCVFYMYYVNYITTNGCAMSVHIFICAFRLLFHNIIYCHSILNLILWKINSVLCLKSFARCEWNFIGKTSKLFIIIIILSIDLLFPYFNLFHFIFQKKNRYINFDFGKIKNYWKLLKSLAFSKQNVNKYEIVIF